VLTRYPTSDKSIRAHYARAVAYYRKPDIDAALAEMDALQKTAPKDAYYYDMRGQILFEHGKIKEAQDAYRKAFQYAPSNPLIQTSLAQTLMAQKNTSPAQFTEAVSLLQKSAQNDASNALSWRLLAEAQGNLGNKGGMHLAQAELAALQNDLKSAESFSMQALQELPSRSPAWYRAQDLSLLITREKENKNDAQSHDLH